MHWASVLQLFYGCVFHRHFYSHRQTIKVCWTHARCPSAGCGSIKSIFLWKWVTVSWGGVEEDRKPRRDEIYIRSFIKPQTLQHPTLKKRSHLTFRLSQNAAWCPFSCGTMGAQWRLVPESIPPPQNQIHQERKALYSTLGGFSSVPLGSLFNWSLTWEASCLNPFHLSYISIL